MFAFLTDWNIEIQFTLKLFMRKIRGLAQVLGNLLTTTRQNSLVCLRSLASWIQRHAANAREAFLSAIAIGVTSWLLSFHEPTNPLLYGLCWTFLVCGIFSLPLAVFRIATNQPAPTRVRRAKSWQYDQDAHN